MHIDKYPPMFNDNDAERSTDSPASVAAAGSSSPSNILSGRVPEYVVTHPGTSQYTQAGGGASACGLAALNCARLILGFHATGLGSAELVQELIERRFLEDVLKPCLTWESKAHLAVDDIYKAPVFKQSLTHLTSHFGPSNYGFFKKIISDIADVTKERRVSACVILTRPPEIIACFSIADVPAGTELFVVFDSHPRPEKHPHGAAFIFYNSVRATARYLTELLRFDEGILQEEDVQWQAQLLAHCSGDVFVAAEAPPSSDKWAETAFETSLQVLGLEAQVREFQEKNAALEGDKKRIREELVRVEHDLLQMDDLLRREQEKNQRLRRKYAPSQPPRSPCGPGPTFSQGESQYAQGENSLWHHFTSSMWPRRGTGSSTSGGTRDDARGKCDAETQYDDNAQGDGYMVHRNGKARRHRETPRDQMRREDEAKRLAAEPAVPPAQPAPPAPPAVPDVDPVAVQLQIYYDEESRELEQQMRDLQAIQPEFFDCGICFEQFQEDHVARVHPCGHAYCRECLTGYAVSKIDEHRYPILCPQCTADRTRTDAPGEIDDAAIQQLGLKEEQYEIFVEMQMNRFSTMIHCRRCQQSLFVDKTEYQETNVIQCPLNGCAYMWCKLCSQEVDPTMQEHTCDGTNELDHLMKQKGWKHCPGCQTPAEKIDGCNHITCGSPGCNSHFCYHCGALIVRSALPREINQAKSDHYNRCKLF